MLFLVATPFGIFLAVLIDKGLRGSRFYQTGLYIPVVLSLALVGFIWQLQYSQDYGFINFILQKLHIISEPVDWYGNPSVNIWAVLVATCWQHVGYIMLLYLAGLKGVDPSLREAAEVDGATEAQTFFRIIFPTMRPINVIVFVITVIQALRAFDIVWVVNKGRNGLELISALVTQNVVGEASRVGLRVGAGDDHARRLAGLHRHLPVDRPARGGAVSTLDTPSTPAPAAAPATPPSNAPRIRRRGGKLAVAFLIAITLLWLFPLFWSVLSSLRDYEYTSEHGYISLGGWTLDNYKNAWARADFTTHFLNSVYVTVPAVLLTLFLASMVGFVIARFSWRFNIVMLGLFTAANLLPQQALLIPLYRLSVNVPLPSFLSATPSCSTTATGCSSWSTPPSRRASAPSSCRTT